MAFVKRYNVDSNNHSPGKTRGTSSPFPGNFLHVLQILLFLVLAAAFGACSTEDPVEVVNRPPTTPANPTPADSATGQAIDLQLGWVCSDPEGGALTFDVYFGTTSPPDTVATGQTQKTYDPPTLGYETTYYWYVVARDDKGQRKFGKIWMFTTVANGAPEAPHTPAPSHLAVDQSVNPTLSWSSTDPEADPLTFDVYLGTSPGPGIAVSDRTQANYTPSPLDYGTTYYWRVNAKDGRNETMGSEWRFTTVANQAPAVPSSPSPADGEGDRPLSNTLTWQCTDPEGLQIHYDIYYGQAGNPPLVATHHSSKSYVLGQLEYGPTYYWKIVAKDDYGNQTDGPVWSFRTLAGAWSPMTSNTTESLRGIWGSSASDIHVVAANGVTLHYNGSAWSSIWNPTDEWLNDVWGLSATNVFAVGERATVLFYNGSVWNSMINPLTSSDHLFGVWGTSMNNVFAVGSEGKIIHYNGIAWATMSSGTTEYLYGIGGIDASNVYALGNDGTLLRYNGTTWLTISGVTSNRLYYAWGLSASDVYVIGWHELLHYDGSSWNPAVSTSIDLRGIWGSAADDIFAVGISGRIIHFDGTTWREMTSGTTEHFYGGVWGTSRSNVYAVGDDGTIMHFGP